MAPPLMLTEEAKTNADSCLTLVREAKQVAKDGNKFDRSNVEAMTWRSKERIMAQTGALSGDYRILLLPVLEKGKGLVAQEKEMKR